jgi:hypothetical protein
MLLLAAIVGSKMYYSTISFTATNIISILLLPFILFFWRKYYKLSHWYLMCICMIVLMVSGQYLMGGKFFATIFIALFSYLVIRMKKRIFLLLPLLVVLFFFIDPLLSFLQSLVENHVYQGKIEQIRIALNMITDPLAMAQIKSSVGITVGGEMVTVTRHLWEHPSFLLFGEGFGGGVPDYYGVLGWGAGHGGYEMKELARNCFTGMHLPIFEMPLKGGIVILIAYLWALYKVFFSKPYAMGIIVFLSLLLVFYVSKEFILLTLLFAKLASETNDTTISSNENKCNYPHI